MTADEVKTIWQESPAWLLRRLGFWLCNWYQHPNMVGHGALFARIRQGPQQGDEATERLMEDLGTCWIAYGAPDPPPDR